MITVVSSLCMKAITYVEDWRGKYKRLVVETTDFVVNLKNHPMKILNYTTPKQIFNFIVLRLLLECGLVFMLRFVTF